MTVAKPEPVVKSEPAVKTVRISYSKLKKKTQTFSLSKVTGLAKNGKKASYTKVSGNKKITINKKTGKVSVKKGLKKGAYQVTAKMRPRTGSSKTVKFAVIVR